MSKFEYNALQFVDFNAGDESDDTDTFFDVDEESTETNEKKENEPLLAIDEEVLSPKQNQIESIKHVKKEESPKENISLNQEIKKGFRRLSADKKLICSSGLPFSRKDVTESTCKNLKKLSITKEENDQDQITMGEKGHSMTTRSDIRKALAELPPLGIVNENKSRKRKLTTRASELPDKFIALAEHTLHFQMDTPPRFHSSRRRSSGSRKGLLNARMSYRPQKTVPKTPKLMTTARARPSIIPSQTERELLELEEMKKHQVKAMPLNEKVLQPPKPLQKSEKAPTVQEPFNLTEVFKKPPPKEETYVFTANPVPRGLLQRKPTKSLSCQSLNTLKATSNYKAPLRVPAFTNKNNMTLEDVHGFGVPVRKVLRPRNTAIKPFSFEERELEKKERKKQQQVEETKQVFKARSPRVLRKSPFKPILEHSHSQPHNLTLNTERRFHERREFEDRHQLKEEMIEYEKKQMALEKARREEEEIARLRKETVHKALPMPTYKTPKKFNSMIPLTVPESPKFSKRTRTTQNSE